MGKWLKHIVISSQRVELKDQVKCSTYWSRVKRAVRAQHPPAPFPTQDFAWWTHNRQEKVGGTSKCTLVVEQPEFRSVHSFRCQRASLGYSLFKGENTNSCPYKFIIPGKYNTTSATGFLPRSAHFCEFFTKQYFIINKIEITHIYYW